MKERGLKTTLKPYLSLFYEDLIEKIAQWQKLHNLGLIFMAIFIYLLPIDNNAINQFSYDL